MRSEVGDSLPDTMETVTNNGVDPSLILSDDELIPGLTELEEMRGEDSITPHDRHKENRGVEEGNRGAEDEGIQINNTDYADDAIPLFIPHGKPKDVDMDDLIHSFGGLGSGRYDDEGIGGLGEATGGSTAAAVSDDLVNTPYGDATETLDTQHDNQQGQGGN